MYVRISKKRFSAVALAVGMSCTAGLPAGAATPAAPAEPASKQENIGVASGLAVGALAGGPIGAILGAVGGALLGERYHRQSATNERLEADLASDGLARGKLATALAESQAHGAKLSETLERRIALETQVGFRTNDATLADASLEQLRSIGALLATLPQMQVRVSGYADQRGTEQANDALSRQRAESVAAVLSAQGVEASRILIEAHGETQPLAADGDLDGYALERRVVVHIEPASQGAVAQVR